MKNTIIIGLLLVLVCIKAQSQSIIFSQFGNTHLLNNPALTGNFSEKWSLIHVFRNQGSAFAKPYSSGYSAFENNSKIFKQNIAFGLFFCNDFTAGTTLNTNALYVSMAIPVKIMPNIVLRYGILAGLVYKNTNLNKQTLPNQFDISVGYFNPSLPANEYFIDEFAIYPDIATGLVGTYHKSGLSIELGGAIYQINKPVESFQSIQNKLEFKYNSHLKIEKNILSVYFIKSDIFSTITNNVSQLLYGLTFGVKNNSITNPNSYFAAIHVRDGWLQNIDACIVSVGFEINFWKFTFSNDLDISGLRISDSKKYAVELMVGYTRPFTNLEKITIPCNRF